MALPEWLKKRAPKEELLQEMRELLRSLSLHTVCEEARCPNIGECFARKTATFMILGDRCTRNCRFCAVKKGNPLPLDPQEPENIAKAVNKLRLKYVVITSVTRDDLNEGGANQFAKTIREIKKLNKEVKIEVLIPDFKGSLPSLKKVIEAEPFVLNHNLETVSHLYSEVRPQANYKRSLKGETFDEIVKVMKDLRKVKCEILTIGQYLRPSIKHLPVKEYIRPEEFQEYKKIGKSLGFLSIISGPFVRSSYRAGEIWEKQKKISTFYLALMHS